MTHIVLMTATNTVTLGKTTYRISSAGTHSMELVGPRGGESAMTQNFKHPQMWAHVTMSGCRAKTTWYRRTDAGVFEVASW